MTIKIKDLDKVETWKGGGLLGPGAHIVTIESVVESTSSGGHPQIEIDFAADDGGGSIRDWLVVIPKTYGKVKSLIEAAGLKIEGDEWAFEPNTLVNRRLRIRVGDEPDFKDPSKTRARVQSYEQLPTDVPGGNGGAPQPAAASDDSDLPF